jgi:hypothetical protein
MKVGASFNPYKVFQGAFAPYWILEHRGIGAGAKLCYIRLLGFAGKDARCYPSLETLGAGLGVSDRQARDYVKELERAGLITVDQRGLRKTNVYLFLWTPELDQLLGAVPDRPSDPGESEPGPEGGRNPDRNTASAFDRNSCSGLDRKNPAGLERNTFVTVESSTLPSVHPVKATRADWSTFCSPRPRPWRCSIRNRWFRA